MTQLRRRGQSPSALSSAGSTLGSPSAFGAPDSRPPSAAGSAVTDLYNNLESVSQVGSVTPSTAAGMQRSVALSGTVASSIPPATLEAEWGTLTSKLRRSGQGYWFGNIFGGAPPGHSIDDLCPGSLCPNARDAHKYCLRTPFQCSHPAPPFQLVVRVGSAESQGGGYQGGHQGGGGKGGNGGGGHRGGRGGRDGGRGRRQGGRGNGRKQQRF